MMPMSFAPKVAVLTLGLILLSTPRARADSVGFNTDYEPNVINLFVDSANAFPSATSASGFSGPSLTPGLSWTVNWSAGNPDFLQLVLTNSNGSLANAGTLTGLDASSPAWLSWTQSFTGTIGSNFTLDWQEVYWNASTNSGTGFVGELQGAGFAAAPYNGPMSGGAPLLIGPTGSPEPSTLLAFGLALACGAVSRGARRLRKKSG